MNAACRFEGCTVLQTGACALENDVSTCPNRVQDVPVAASTTVGTDAPSSAVDDLGAAVLQPPGEIPRFPPSAALSLQAAEEMMATRYGTIVGILGDPESGKTACLVSLYLLVAHAKLSGWTCSDSRSLMAFEAIARGARRWKEGRPPEQMTVHTELSDDRVPGFLHLQLRQQATGQTMDLFLPDLPGEWTKDLIDTSDVGRFSFMKSADVVWVVVDGSTLIRRERRQGAIHRINILCGRIAKIFEQRKPKLILAVTHRDLGDVSEDTLVTIRQEIEKQGFSLDIVPVASFSTNEVEAPAGFGMATLIDATARPSQQPLQFRRSTTPKEGMRSFLAFRRGE